jgi:hypothetical protein
MVRYEDRIRRMQESGILTAAQAGRICWQALQGGMTVERFRRDFWGRSTLFQDQKIPLGLVAGFAVAAIVVAVAGPDVGRRR